VVRISAGFVLLGAGLVGWLLPIIPGWLLVIPGLILLSKEFHWARRTVDWARSKLPKKSRDSCEKQPASEPRPPLVG
jgi:hypothetical protein